MSSRRPVDRSPEAAPGARGHGAATRWRILGAALALAYVAFSLSHLGGAYWDSDEGLNLMKGRLFGLGYALYDPIWSDQPPGYTGLLALAFTVAGPSVAAARAVTFAFALLAMWAGARIAGELCGGRLARMAAAAALALAPNFFWASRAAMIGLPALALAAAAMAMTLGYAARGRRRDLALAGLLLGLSCWMKLIGAYLVVPIGLAVWLRRRDVRAARDGAGPPGPARRQDEVVRDLAALALAIGLPLAAMLLLFDGRALLGQVVGTVVGARGAEPLDVAWNAVKLADWGIARDIGRADWTFGDHAWLVAPALAGLVVALRRRREAGIVVGFWLGLTLIALLVQNPLWPKHHFLALLVLMAPLAGLGIEWATSSLITEWRARAGSAAGSGADVTFGVGLLGALVIAAAIVPLPAAIRADVARVSAVPLKESGKLPSHSDSWLTLDEAVAFLRAHTRPGDWVVTDHAFVAFKADRPVPPELAVISSKRVATGRLTAEEVIAVTRRRNAAAVLFWDGDRLTDAFPAFVDWVAWNYEAVDGAPAGWALWVRKEGS